MIIAADVTRRRAAGARALPAPRRARELGRRRRELDELGEQRGIGKGPEVVERARTATRRRSTRSAIIGERLGVGIANVMNLFDPDVVVIGGGVSARRRRC